MTQIKLTLAIFGDVINLKLLNDIVKVSPTSFWEKGDIISNRKNGLVRQETCWEFTKGFIQTLDFEDISSQFIELLKPNIHLIENYINENNLHAKIYIVVEIVNDEKPSLFISKNLMELILRMNGEIDIDLYYLDEQRDAAKTREKSVNQLNIAVQRGQAPKGIVRFDKSRGTKNLPQDEVHFLDGSSLYRDGTWRHDNGYKLTNEQIEFLIQNGWSIPK